jgi:hypothetical protein
LPETDEQGPGLATLVARGLMETVRAIPLEHNSHGAACMALSSTAALTWKAVLQNLSGRLMASITVCSLVVMPHRYGAHLTYQTTVCLHSPPARCALRYLAMLTQTIYGWPLGKNIVWVRHSGRSRPCIRRLICSDVTAARPDEVSRRTGPDQWDAHRGALVRTGCPVPRITVPVPSPDAAPHHLWARRFVIGLALDYHRKPRGSGSCRLA